MVLHIQNFFTAFLGVTLPEIVFVIFGVALVYLIMRAFFSIFGIKCKMLDFAFYSVIAYLTISNLGGLEWNFSFLS
jgi:hypothetical protein